MTSKKNGEKMPEKSLEQGVDDPHDNREDFLEWVTSIKKKKSKRGEENESN